MIIKIDDLLFSHAQYSTDFQDSKYIEWDRNFINGKENIVVYTDNSLTRVNNNIKTKIAWLLESPVISSHQHEWIKLNQDKFDIVFTNNKELLDLNNKFNFLPTGGCWIKKEDQKIWNKKNKVSIIASNKNFTDGHKLRYDIIKKFNNKVDIFGRGINTINYKLDGLKDYMFSIVVENTKKDYYFTEKIIDCFATGTIPIYWGCPSIGKFFNEKGIITFENIIELENIINNLNENLYNDKIEYIKENFKKYYDYIIAEDYMWTKYLKNL